MEDSNVVNTEVVSATGSTVSAEKLASLKQLTQVIYILYALGFFTGVTWIVALMMNYIKREDTEGTIYASHFTWQIRTFWWCALWTVLGFITMPLLGLGFLVLAGNSLWAIYRIVKGFLNWNDNKPMSLPA